MRGLSSFPLDITDRILTWLPDFNSLQASIVASKPIHAVFQTHPKSIIRAVACNVVGPALPEALGLVRRQLLPSKPGLNPDDIINGDNMSSPLEPEEVRKLVANAKVVGTLEYWFSCRHKDRKSETSLLSSVESLRFQSAMYRIWLFSDIFPARGISGVAWQCDIDNSRRNQKALLDVFSSEELCQLQMIAEFLREMYDSVVEDRPRISHEVSLAFGPDIILQCFEAQTARPLVAVLQHLGVQDGELSILDGYLFFSLSQVWEERKGDGPPAKAYKPIILDTISGENDRCCRCDTVHGVDLWDESNWAALGRHITLNMSLFKGRLAANKFESAGLLNTFSPRDFPFADFMQEIHDIKTAAYDNWEKKDALCRACVVDVIRCHLHLWYLEQRRKGGQQIPEDCRYGYDCRIQVCNYAHAKKLNHFCEPKRGDQ